MQTIAMAANNERFKKTIEDDDIEASLDNPPTPDPFERFEEAIEEDDLEARVSGFTNPCMSPLSSLCHEHILSRVTTRQTHT